MEEEEKETEEEEERGRCDTVRFKNMSTYSDAANLGEHKLRNLLHD